MPLISRLRRYTPSDFKADAIAGITVAVVLVPQAMAYAVLAGLPPVVGLYAATIPALVYAWIGSSRHMAIGPVAIVSLLIASGLGEFAEIGTALHSELAILLCFLVSGIFFVLGLIRAGFLVNFISHPTILGFNGGAALLTGASQLRSFFGVPKSAIPGLQATRPWPVLLHLDRTHLTTMVVAAVTLALLIGLRRFAKKLPAYLIVCVLGTLASWWFDLSARGVGIIGDIPTGMPSPRLPHFEWGTMLDLLPTALAIVIVGYSSSITVVKALAAKENDSLQPNRELWAFGFANLASGLFGAFPVTAGLARSTVAAQAGARTQLTCFLSSVVVLAVLFYLAPLFELLPHPVLASIIIIAASRLFDIRGAISVFRTKRTDGITIVAAFVGTIALGLQEGLAIGMLAAILFFVARSTRPHNVELGRIPGTQVYRNAKRFEVETCPQIGLLRIDAPLYYANARFLEDRILAMFAARPQMKLLALDCASVNDMDATAAQSLRRIIENLRDQDHDLHLVAAIGPVRDLLDRSGLAELIGSNNMHRTLLEAAPLLMAAVSRTFCEQSCRSSAFPECTQIRRPQQPSEEPAGAAAQGTPN